MDRKNKQQLPYTKWLSLGIIPFALSTLTGLDMHANAEDTDSSASTTAASVASSADSTEYELKSPSVTPESEANNAEQTMPTDNSTDDVLASESAVSNDEPSVPSDTESGSTSNEPTSSHSQATTNIITNPSSASTTSAVSDLTSEQISTVKTDVNSVLSTFAAEQQIDITLTDIRQQGARLTASLQSGVSLSDVYNTLRQISDSVIVKNRKFYLQTLAGNGIDLFFTLQTPSTTGTLGTQLTIPIIVNAVDDEGNLLSSTSVTDANGDGLVYGSSWKTEAPDIPGYSVISAVSNASGTWDENFDYSFLNENNQFIIQYRYTPTKQYAQIAITDSATGRIIKTISLTGAYNSTQTIDLNSLIADYLDDGYSVTANSIPDNGITYNTAGIIQKFVVIISAPTAESAPAQTPTTSNNTDTPESPLSPTTELSQPKSETTDLPIISERPSEEAQLLFPQLIHQLNLTYISQTSPFTLTARAKSNPIANSPVDHYRSVESITSTFNTDKEELQVSTNVNLTRKHQNMPSHTSDQVWAIVHHPDIIPNPGSNNRGSELSRYFLSINGTINFGMTDSEISKLT